MRKQTPGTISRQRHHSKRDSVFIHDSWKVDEQTKLCEEEQQMFFEGTTKMNNPNAMMM
jgi:hypothetical protein